jgi:DNA polymerase-4
LRRYNPCMPRIILHLDLDAFFCSVEELHDPALRGKAFAVGGSPERRGVIASCSYAARAYGVRSAMPTSQALRLCPDLLVISHHFDNYSEMSDRVMERLNYLSPLVEQISVDEAFADISDIREPANEVARKLQKRVNEELQLPCSIGVAGSKLVAKIATEVGKKTSKRNSPPNAITIVPAGSEATFLHPLPVEMLWGVGPKTAARLAAVGIKTIGDIAMRPTDELVRLFGEHGREMARRAVGDDNSPIITSHEPKSISQETTFARDVSDDRQLQQTLREQAAQVGHRLRKSGICGNTVRLKLRWPDFTTLTRQVALNQPTDQDEEIYQNALALLSRVRSRGKPVRLIGVGVSGLGKPLRQMELWGAENERSRALQQALDEVRARYGKKAILRGQINKEGKEK